MNLSRRPSAPLSKNKTKQIELRGSNSRKRREQSRQTRDQSGSTHGSQSVVHRRSKQRERTSETAPDETVAGEHRSGNWSISGDEICERRGEGVEYSHSKGDRADDGDDPVNGTVGRERYPKETNRDEDTTDLTHDESEFRSDGTVLLDLFERKPTQNGQPRGEEKVT